jgi:two-component system sensor histidine kinase/response regulator
MRIAYVEDNPTNQELVERVARMTHHRIIPFSEGEIALEALQQEQFDLILMDVELAGKVNGLDVVRTLRGQGMRTPIIAVTAYAMMGDRERCLAAGCNDYLPKPIPIKDLLAMLERYEALAGDGKATVLDMAQSEQAPTPVAVAPPISDPTPAEPVAPVADSAHPSPSQEAPEPSAPVPPVTESAQPVAAVGPPATADPEVLTVPPVETVVPTSVGNTLPMPAPGQAESTAVTQQDQG